MILTWWRSSPWLTLSTGLALLILLGLGTWQLQRLQWKQELIASMQAGLAAPPRALPSSASELPALDFHRVSAGGRLLHDRPLFLGPRQHERRPGVHLLVPLMLDDGRVLLVNRGWLPGPDADTADIHQTGAVMLTGILRTRFAKGPFTPDYDSAARLWFWYDLDGMARETGLPLLPAVLEADADADNADGLPISGVTRIDVVNNHLQYAFTWYGLAAALVAVFVVFQRQRNKT